MPDQTLFTAFNFRVEIAVPDVSDELCEAAFAECDGLELTMEPKNTVEVGKGDAKALLGLLDALEEHDDVSEVHANFDIPDEILTEIAA